MGWPSRTRSAALACAGSLSLLAAWAAAGAQSAPEEAGGAPVFDERALRRILSMSPLPEPPPDPTNEVADDPRAARLGQRLFFDARLSASGARSCASCHDPARAFSDGEVLALGEGRGMRNTPAIWNLAYARWLFWDGRSDTLWGQALQPIENPIELAGSRTAVVLTLARDAELRAEYEALFGPLPDSEGLPERAHPGDSETPAGREAERAWQALAPEARSAIDAAFANVGKAIAAYERKLVSRRARFDVFVEGLREDSPEKRAALSPSEQRGLHLFVGRADCRRCHSGPNFTDGEFHDLMLPPAAGDPAIDRGRWDGLARARSDPFGAAGPHSAAPEGDAALRTRSSTAGPDLVGQFKTPSLRNVALTAPYMHAGQFAELSDVLHYYDTLEGAQPSGHHQETVLAPLALDPGERADLEAFLRALSDVDLDPALLAPPAE